MDKMVIRASLLGLLCISLLGMVHLATSYTNAKFQTSASVTITDPEQALISFPERIEIEVQDTIKETITIEKDGSKSSVKETHTSYNVPDIHITNNTQYDITLDNIVSPQSTNSINNYLNRLFRKSIGLCIPPSGTESLPIRIKQNIPFEEEEVILLFSWEKGDATIPCTLYVDKLEPIYEYEVIDLFEKPNELLDTGTDKNINISHKPIDPISDEISSIKVDNAAQEITDEDISSDATHHSDNIDTDRNVNEDMTKADSSTERSKEDNIESDGNTSDSSYNEVQSGGTEVEADSMHIIPIEPTEIKDKYFEEEKKSGDSILDH